MVDTALLEHLKAEGYAHIREIDGRGICGVRRMLYTVGLFYGITEYIYRGRYCYPNWLAAKQALEEWDGKGDPPGEWIKHKGITEYYNPNNKNTRDDT